MKLFSTQQGFWELIKEAKEQTFIDNDYARTNSTYATSIYHSKTHKYILVENVDYGTCYSIEKLEI